MVPRGIPKGRREAAITIARERGVNEAARATGFSVGLVQSWMAEEPQPDNPEVLVVDAPGTELVTLDPNEVIDGLPARGTRAYIDQVNIAKRAAAQAAYVAARRGELRVKMVDTAHVLIDRLSEAENGRDAQAYAIAVGIVFDKVRLDSGQVTDLRGVALLRGDLDDEQRKGRVAPAIPDLSTPVGVIDAESEEIFGPSIDEVAERV